MIQHVIHKICFHLPVTSYEQGIEVQSKSKHWAGHSLPALIENHLDELARPDEIILMDSLIIDLNDFPWNLSVSEWQSTLDSVLSQNTSRIPGALMIYNQWLYYLKSGCFERNAILKSINESELYLDKHLKLVEEKPVLFPSPGSISSSFLKRLFLLHSEAFLLLLLQVWFGIQSHLAEEFLRHSKKVAVSNPETLAIFFNQLFILRRSGSQHTCVESIAEFKTEDPVWKPQATAKPKEKEESTSLQETPPEVDSGFLDCPNAGIVILFPYLKRFLENIQLIQHDAFASDEARHSAIHALYYLATGSSQGEEHEYVIMKILCGIDVEEYVQFESELPSDMIREINEFLTSVIGHWSVLQNTTIDGLRATFLQRTGKLSIVNERYILQMEESGVDILLGKLPWGFRNYKLPWMRFSLITEWY